MRRRLVSQLNNASFGRKNTLPSISVLQQQRAFCSTTNFQNDNGRKSNGKSQTKSKNRGKDKKDVVTPFHTPKENVLRNSSLNRLPAIPPQKRKDAGKICLVLDIDETLIHSKLEGSQMGFRQEEERQADVSSCDEFTLVLHDGEIVKVNKRPGLDEFLEWAGHDDNFEVCAYTAGVRDYAGPLLDYLDPQNKIFRHRLYRDSCLFVGGYYLKDLRKFNRPMSRIVLCDNNPYCFLPQPSNGIPISNFYDDPNDNALGVLRNYLETLRKRPDVRTLLRKSFGLENLLAEHREAVFA